MESPATTSYVLQTDERKKRDFMLSIRGRSVSIKEWPSGGILELSAYSLHFNLTSAKILTLQSFQIEAKYGPLVVHVADGAEKALINGLQKLLCLKHAHVLRVLSLNITLPTGLGKVANVWDDIPNQTEVRTDNGWIVIRTGPKLVITDGQETLEFIPSKIDTFAALPFDAQIKVGKKESWPGQCILSQGGLECTLTMKKKTKSFKDFAALIAHAETGLWRYVKRGPGPPARAESVAQLRRQATAANLTARSVTHLGQPLGLDIGDSYADQLNDEDDEAFTYAEIEQPCNWTNLLNSETVAATDRPEFKVKWITYNSIVSLKLSANLDILSPKGHIAIPLTSIYPIRIGPSLLRVQTPSAAYCFEFPMPSQVEAFFNELIRQSLGFEKAETNVQSISLSSGTFSLESGQFSAIRVPLIQSDMRKLLKAVMYSRPLHSLELVDCCLSLIDAEPVVRVCSHLSRLRLEYMLQPAELAGLLLSLPTTLKELSLRGNLIKEAASVHLARFLRLPECILEQLDLSETFPMPDGLERMMASFPASLTTFRFDGNQLGNGLKGLARNLSRAKRLTEVSLGRNHIGSEGVATLLQFPSNIETLHLNDNKIDRLPELITYTKLKYLHLQRNLLRDLPDNLVTLKSLVAVNFETNPLPAVITECKSTPDVLAHLANRSKKKQFWPEVKVLVVGQEGVGKTSLIEAMQLGKLRDPTVNESTEGIEISELKVKKGIRRKFGRRTPGTALRIFDFGGQEVFYPVHEFFLSSRSLYLAVFSCSNFEPIRLIYWLQKILSIASPPPPVLLVGTHRDQMTSESQALLQKQLEIMLAPVIDHFNLIQLIFVSNTTGESIQNLLAAVQEIALNTGFFPHVPKEFVLMLEKVKASVDETKVCQQDMKFFEEICLSSDMGLEMAKEFVQFLKDLGYVVYYQTPKTELYLLGTGYLAKTFATVVTFKNRFVKTGLLELPTLWNVLWGSLSPDAKTQMLQIFEFFELMYQHQTRINTLIIPSLLSPAPPEDFPSLFPVDCEPGTMELCRRWAPTLWTRGLFPRLIFRLEHIGGAKVLARWLHGSLLQMDTDIAYVSFDELRQVVTLTYRSAKRDTRFFVVVRNTIDGLMETVFALPSENVRRFLVYREAGYEQQIAFETAIAALSGGKATLGHPQFGEIRLEALAPDLALNHIREIPDSEELQVGALLGMGGFATVYKGSWKGTAVAVKQLRLSDDHEVAAGQYEDFVTEAAVMAAFQHKNIVSLYGVQMRKHRLILEFVPNGDLCNNFHHPDPILGEISAVKQRLSDCRTQLQQSKSAEAQQALDQLTAELERLETQRDEIDQRMITFETRLKVMLDIAGGMRYLHSLSPPILHRDLRSPNVFLVTMDPTAPVMAKVADFGLSRQLVGNVGGQLGTWQWLAPEVIFATHQGYDESSDVYSFAIVMWEILAGPGRNVPFDNYKVKGQVRNETKLKEAVAKNGLRPPIPPVVEAQHRPLAQLIRECWHSDLARRPSFIAVAARLHSELGLEDPDASQYRERRPRITTVPLAGHSFHTLSQRVLRLLPLSRSVLAGTANGELLVVNSATCEIVKRMAFTPERVLSLLKIPNGPILGCAPAPCTDVIVLDPETFSVSPPLRSTQVQELVSLAHFAGHVIGIGPRPTSKEEQETTLLAWPDNMNIQDPIVKQIPGAGNLVVASREKLWIGGHGFLAVLGTDLNASQGTRLECGPYRCSALFADTAKGRIWSAHGRQLVVWNVMNLQRESHYDHTDVVESIVAVGAFVFLGTASSGVAVLAADTCRPLNLTDGPPLKSQVKALCCTHEGNQARLWCGVSQMLETQRQEMLQVWIPQVFIEAQKRDITLRKRQAEKLANRTTTTLEALMVRRPTIFEEMTEPDSSGTSGNSAEDKRSSDASSDSASASADRHVARAVSKEYEALDPSLPPPPTAPAVPQLAAPPARRPPKNPRRDTSSPDQLARATSPLSVQTPRAASPGTTPGSPRGLPFGTHPAPRPASPPLSPRQPAPAAYSQPVLGKPLGLPISSLPAQEGRPQGLPFGTDTL